MSVRGRREGGRGGEGGREGGAGKEGERELMVLTVLTRGGLVTLCVCHVDLVAHWNRTFSRFHWESKANHLW